METTARKARILRRAASGRGVLTGCWAALEAVEAATDSDREAVAWLSVDGAEGEAEEVIVGEEREGRGEEEEDNVMGDKRLSDEN